MHLNFKYTIKNSNAIELLNHIEECKDNFNPPLNDTLNLKDYSEKIYEKSTTIEAWDGKKLIGFISVYLNDFQSLKGYITLVSVLKEYNGLGIATKLLNLTVEYARKQGFKEIKLEVYKNNIKALKLYKNFSFSEIECNDESIFMVLVL